MKFGDMELFLLADGEFRLDGGAMFGVVPRTMWAKLAPPDDQNRIMMDANPLLIRSGDRTILVDTGLGGKWDEKEKGYFHVAEPRTLMTDLARVDLLKEEVTDVIQTHLHFDHSGGGTFIDKDGQLKVQFPNARYWIQRGEWEAAIHPNAKDRRSYKVENLRPLEEAGVIEWLDGDGEIYPGISVRITGGHTMYHQMVQVDSGGNRLVFAGDILPRATHVPLSFIMAYDLYPVESMAFKEPFLDEAVDNQYLIIFEHDPETKAGHLVRDEKGRISVHPFDMEQATYER